MFGRNFPPTLRESIVGKTLIIIGLITALYFYGWLLNPDFIGNKYLYIIIIISFGYKIFIRIIEWFTCFHLSVPEKPKITKKWTVDVLTTYCKGEPKEMIIETLQAIQEIKYPHTTYLCDEADDAELKEICNQLGIIHVTRTEKVNAKAGNINNALKTLAKGEICLILDPDHKPYPEFLDEVLPYFEDESVGFVQVPQVYYNQEYTIIAKAAAQQTYQFYGPFMMGLNSYGAVPAIGANCTFRRSALDSIGGHAPGLTEDMHTAMLLHSKKWKSVYNPVIVAKGLVPWNYSGYCLQQLKWARGSFDLFLNVIPKIWRSLTWKQLGYYLSPVVFFLFGLFALIDFTIPIISLLFGIIPIKISITAFAINFAPLFLISFFIRQFNQRWLLERHEKGAFIYGGTLFKASWWASLLGLIYTFLKKKVPYIPTPKDFRHENPYLLLIPNLVIILLSIFAIIYGLNRDFNLFMLFMAFLAFVNIIILGLGSLMSLQLLIIYIHRIFQNSFISKGSKNRLYVHEVKQTIFSFIQKNAVFLVLIFAGIVSLGYYNHKKSLELLKQEATVLDNFAIPEISVSNSHDLNIEKSQFIYDTIEINKEILNNSISFYNKCSKSNKSPFYFIKFNNNQLDTLINGAYDPLFTKLFTFFRVEYYPVMICITTENINEYPIREKLSNGLSKLATLSNNVFFPNIAWVWSIDKKSSEPFIEQNKFIISWLICNDKAIGLNEDKIELLKKINKPLLVFKNNKIKSIYFNEGKSVGNIAYFKSQTKPDYNSTKLNLKQRIPYIKGVSYNPGHDWRDNIETLPLTREKLEADFENIKKMGANTIRRYSSSFYDQNILNIANEKGLKVLYGFWFEKEVDYITDQRKINKYRKEVLRFVEKHKNDTTILAWTLGNETWGLLKLHFSEPYLSYVRVAYLKLIDELTNKIKEIDSIHPVLLVEEHTSHITSAAFALNKYVPNIDAFGINSYYIENISKLDSLMQEVNPQKPYLVSEFGPKGYWQREYTDYDNTKRIVEQNSFDKSDMYKVQWKNYIESNKAKNLGGVAFCWQDRYEGTATWFGITDIFGNKKPSWYAIRDVFGDRTEQLTFPNIPPHRIFLPKHTNGNNFKVIAACMNSSKREHYYYKWIIYEDKTFDKIYESSFKKGGYEHFVTVPSSDASYRIYVYISDNNGNVITESSPLNNN